MIFDGDVRILSPSLPILTEEPPRGGSPSDREVHGDGAVIVVRIRLLLESYYEPRFSDRSHGFRRGRGYHTALREITQKWRGIKWFVEGDIKGCYDNIDHDVLLAALSENIHDNRLLRLISNMLEASVGSIGDSYDNALAETVNRLFKTEVIWPRGPWRSVEEVERATLEWVDWFNHRRLLGPIGHVPPSEFEHSYYREQSNPVWSLDLCNRASGLPGAVQ